MIFSVVIDIKYKVMKSTLLSAFIIINIRFNLLAERNFGTFETGLYTSNWKGKFCTNISRPFLYCSSNRKDKAFKTHISVMETEYLRNDFGYRACSSLLSDRDIDNTHYGDLTSLDCYWEENSLIGKFYKFQKQVTQVISKSGPIPDAYESTNRKSTVINSSTIKPRSSRLSESNGKVRIFERNTIPHKADKFVNIERAIMQDYGVYFPIVFSKNKSINSYISSISKDKGGMTIRIPNKSGLEFDEVELIVFMAYSGSNTEGVYSEAGYLNFSFPKWETPGDNIGVCMGHEFSVAFPYTPYIIVSLEIDTEDVSNQFLVWVDYISRLEMQICLTVVDSEADLSLVSGSQGKFHFVAYTSALPSIYNESIMLNFTAAAFNSIWTNFSESFDRFAKSLSFKSFNNIFYIEDSIHFVNHTSALEIKLQISTGDDNVLKAINEEIMMQNSTTKLIRRIDSLLGPEIVKAIAQLCSEVIEGLFVYFCAKMLEYYSIGSFSCKEGEAWINGKCSCPPHHIKDSTTDACKSCNASSYALNNECVNCPDGAFPNPYSFSCKCATLGYGLQDLLATECVKCEHLNVGTGTCCTEGQSYINTKCQCVEGGFESYENKVCVLCPPNTLGYCCEASMYWDRHRLMCKCNNPSYGISEKGKCEKCPQGEINQCYACQSSQSSSLFSNLSKKCDSCPKTAYSRPSNCHCNDLENSDTENKEFTEDCVGQYKYNGQCVSICPPSTAMHHNPDNTCYDSCSHPTPYFSFHLQECVNKCHFNMLPNEMNECEKCPQETPYLIAYRDLCVKQCPKGSLISKDSVCLPNSLPLQVNNLAHCILNNVSLKASISCLENQDSLITSECKENIQQISSPERTVYQYLTQKTINCTLETDRSDIYCSHHLLDTIPCSLLDHKDVDLNMLIAYRDGYFKKVKPGLSKKAKIILISVGGAIGLMMVICGLLYLRKRCKCC